MGKGQSSQDRSSGSAVCAVQEHEIDPLDALNSSDVREPGILLPPCCLSQYLIKKKEWIEVKT